MAEVDAGLVRLLPEIELVGPGSGYWSIASLPTWPGSMWSWMFWPKAPVPTWAALQGGPSRLLTPKCQGDQPAPCPLLPPKERTCSASVSTFA